METYECYHGTSAKDASTIISQQRFLSSMKDDEWVGHGVYFFINPLPSLVLPTAYDNARNWAKYIKKANSPAVLKSIVTIDRKRILDLRDEYDLELFNKFRLEIYLDARRRAYSNGLQLEEQFLYKQKLDCFSINELCKSCDPPLSAVIAKVFINFNAKRRYPVSQFPNCTILCIRDTSLIDNISVAHSN